MKILRGLQLALAFSPDPLLDNWDYFNIINTQINSL